MRVPVDDPSVAPRVNEARPGNDDCPMREASTKLEHRYVCFGWLPTNLSRVAHHAVEIPFGIAVQVPIRRVEAHFDLWYHASRSVDFYQQCQTVGSATLNPSHMMIWSSEPLPSFVDYFKPASIRGASFNSVRLVLSFSEF